MKTVLILEDEEYTLEFIKLLVDQHPLTEQVVAAGSSRAAVEAARTYLPQLALLDIELGPDDPYNGIQTAKMIAGVSPHTICVFLTGYGEYALESFSVHPYDYILKPIHKEKLNQVLTDILSKRGQTDTNEKIALKCKEGTIILYPDTIACIEKQDKRTLIHVGQNVYETNYKLSELEEMLPEQFIRAHNSYIINLARVLMVKSNQSRSYQVTFDDCPAEAWMSRIKYEECKHLFMPLNEVGKYKSDAIITKLTNIEETLDRFPKA